jgi:hypothetical protein
MVNVIANVKLYIWFNAKYNREYFIYTFRLTFMVIILYICSMLI